MDRNLILAITLSFLILYIWGGVNNVKKNPYPVDNKKFTYDCEILGRDIIDLTDPIREDMIIALPIRPLCDEACKGLCFQCGQNLNLNQCQCRKGEHTMGGPFSILEDLH